MPASVLPVLAGRPSQPAAARHAPAATSAYAAQRCRCREWMAMNRGTTGICVRGKLAAVDSHDTAVPARRIAHDAAGLPLREMLLLPPFSSSAAAADVAAVAALAHSQAISAGYCDQHPKPLACHPLPSSSASSSPVWFPADHQSLPALNRLMLHEALIRLVRLCTACISGVLAWRLSSV